MQTYLIAFVLSLVVLNTGYAGIEAESIKRFGFSLSTMRALQRKDIHTIGEVALINDKEEVNEILAGNSKQILEDLNRGLTTAGLSFGRSPFPDLDLRDRVLLHRTGVKDDQGLRRYKGFLRDQSDSENYEDRLNMLSLKLRAKISSLTADPQMEAEGRLKLISDEIDGLLQLIRTHGESVLNVSDRNGEIVHKTTVQLESFRRVLDHYRQQAECQNAMRDKPES